MTRTSINRRMGPVGSPAWHSILDGAEATIVEEGYGALSSRRVAERVGIKQRLVYYYFETMDEVVIETFRRLSQRELDRMRTSLCCDMPVRQLWDVCIHTADARVTSEFMALAHRNEGLRQEVVHFIEESRRIQAEAIQRSLTRAQVSLPLDANGLALAATSVALSMTREDALGVTKGHDSLITLIESLIDRIEPIPAGMP